MKISFWKLNDRLVTRIFVLIMIFNKWKIANPMKIARFFWSLLFNVIKQVKEQRFDLKAYIRIKAICI